MPALFMNPDRLRRIDAWIGVPACFILTVADRVRRLVSRPTQPAPPRQILLIELAEMGTTVLAAPAVHRLRSRYPSCTISFLVFKHIADSVHIVGLTSTDQVLTIDVSSVTSFVRDTWRVIRLMRERGIDTVINLEMFARFSTILSYLTGARTRVGFHPFTQSGIYVGHLFTHPVLYSPHLHTWQSLLTLVNALEEPASDVPFGKLP